PRTSPSPCRVRGHAMATTEPAPFGALLLRFRAAAGFTQEQLAARAGLSPNAVAALERGRRRTPRATTVELLAAALGLEAPAREQLVAAARGTGRIGPPEGARAVSSGARRDSEGDLPPLPALAAAQPTRLLGRAGELEAIRRRLVGEGDEGGGGARL